MTQEIYKEEYIGNLKLTAIVWKLDEGWTAQGSILEDNLSSVNSHINIFPEKDFYPSREEAGEAVWSVLNKKASHQIYLARTSQRN